MAKDKDKKHGSIAGDIVRTGDDSLNESLNVHHITEVISGKVSDLLYISEKVHMPEKKDIKRCYRTDFRLLPNKEAKKVCSEKKGIVIDKEFENHEFFVYNERKNTLLPFKKNDYLMNEKEYMTYDGEKYLYFDNDGNLKDYMKVENGICSYYTYDRNKKEETLLYKENLDGFEEEKNADEIIREEYKENKKNKKGNKKSIA